MFFDIHLIMISRYPRWLSDEFKNTVDNCKFIYIYEEDVGVDESALINILPEQSVIEKVAWPSKKNIESIFDRYKPDVLFVSGQRLPDAPFVMEAKKRSVNTYMFQHGLYIEFMRRSIKFYFDKLMKTFRYAVYAYTISKYINRNGFKVLIEYIKIFVQGSKKQAESKVLLEKPNVDIVFVIGDYWKKFHSTMFGYRNDQQINIGYPDLMMLTDIKKQNYQNKSVCYICQSLVEDGRLDRKHMVDFLYKMVSSLPTDTILYFKLHHESDMSLYDPYVADNVVVINNLDLLPYCGKYVGHYSSFLALPLSLTDEVLLWEFPGHDTPFYYNESCLYVTNSDSELYKFMVKDVGVAPPVKRNDASEYFCFDGVSPYKKIVDYVLG
jgi:hypothetical protein